ncbi:MAG: cytochrome P450 [Actinobacteria bacterium]|nr:MAG: cytochrome P450 [Actinomycetota bacterium]
MSARAAKLPPGPSGVELVRWFLRARRDPSAAFDELARYGDIVRLHNVLPQSAEPNFFLLRKPEDVKHVLQENHRNYRKSSTYDVVRLVVGDGLLTSEGDHWKRQRRLAQPSFHKERIAHFARAMVEEAEAMLARWERAPASGMDIAEEMRRVTLAVVGRTLFSSDVERYADAVSRGLEGALDYVDRRLNSPIQPPMWLRTPRQRRFGRAMAQLDGVAADVIASRRGREHEFEDLLSMLMLAEDEESGGRMSERQVRDEVMTFLLAGHETSANALAWSLYLLATHTLERDRLEREVDEALVGRAPSMDDLPRLPFARMVIEEALRLYPPVWMIERHALAPDVLGGYSIPAGSAVVTSPYVVHRSPTVWDAPLEFRPSRFTPEAVTSRPPFAYFPFGGGPRQCIGNTFALVETQLILTRIVSRFRVDIAPGARPALEPKITLRPGGLRMTVRARDRVTIAAV